MFHSLLQYISSAKDKWSSGVVVNMPPCHGGDRGFESHLDRHYYYQRLTNYVSLFLPKILALLNEFNKSFQILYSKFYILRVCFC